MSDTTRTVWFERSGFFGPRFHSKPDCCDRGPASSSDEEFDLPEALFPLPDAWCCFKCGDYINGVVDEEMREEREARG